MIRWVELFAKNITFIILLTKYYNSIYNLFILFTRQWLKINANIF